MSTSTPNRVLTRRGSTTASDPFGVHAAVNLNPNRSSSSKLTIVRVPPTVLPSTSTNEPPASPTISQRRLLRRGPPTSTEPTSRVSFAFSTFGSGHRPSSPDQPASPSSSPRLRPSSPHLTAATYGGMSRLSADQLVDLARQSTNPSKVAQDITAPATFTPLPDDIFLPFIDRPSEVSALISSPPDLKLFTLLAQIFRSKHLPSPDDFPQELPRDPTQWSYNQLVYHLTRVDRDVAPDFIWAIAARKCIVSHSELIWERVKGGLGVPPELDLDYGFLDDDHSSPDTSDISDDEGRAARGHWSDWDAIMDSPVYVRNVNRLSLESVPSIYSGRRVEDLEAHFRSQMDGKLQGLQEGFIQSSSTNHDEVDGGASTIVPTPHPELEPLSIPQNVPQSPEYISIEPLLAPSASSTFSTLSNANPPPLSLPASLAPLNTDGLGDIAEGAEEEESEQELIVENASVTVESSNESSSDPDKNLISPKQIQGLRISTSPLPPSNSFGAPMFLSPISPLPPYPNPVSNATSSSTITLNNYTPLQMASQTQTQPIPSSSSYASSRSHSRASSFSSVGPFQRSESTGNLAASWNAAASGSGSYAGSVIGSDAGDSGGYLSDGDRMPGNPLFPSNFARLAIVPTMRANNPATRPSHILPQARYVSTSSTFGRPSVVNRPGKVRAYSHGASTLGKKFDLIDTKRQSWEPAPGADK